MSTQVQLHVKTDEMNRAILMELGAIGGPLASLASTASFEDATDAARDAPSYIVGNSSEQFPSDMLNIVGHVQEVDDDLIDKIDAHAPDDDIIDFLEEHRGEEVFTVGW